MKKKNHGINDRNIFNQIKLSPRSLPTPVKFEPYMLPDGGRQTRVYFSGHHPPADQSVDDLMSKAYHNPAILVDPTLWIFILPHLKNSATGICNFWRYYDCEEATDQRRSAAHGLQFQNRVNEQQLLGLISEYKALFLESYGINPNDSKCSSLLGLENLTERERQFIMDQLKDKMVDWLTNAVWNDNDAPKRLHEILKNSKKTVSPYAEEKTISHKFFHAFVQLVTENWALPTKKAVRKKAGYGDLDIDLANAAKAYKKLGLNGLRQD